MTNKVTPIKSAELSPQVTTPLVLPQDLQDKIGAIRALAVTLNLLDKTPVPHVQAEQVRMAMTFQNKLYEDTVGEALAHPDSCNSPDLEYLRKARSVVQGETATVTDAEKLIEARRKREKKAQKLKPVNRKAKGKQNGKATTKARA